MALAGWDRMGAGWGWAGVRAGQGEGLGTGAIRLWCLIHLLFTHDLLTYLRANLLPYFLTSLLACLLTYSLSRRGFRLPT